MGSVPGFRLSRSGRAGGGPYPFRQGDPGCMLKKQLAQTFGTIRRTCGVFQIEADLSKWGGRRIRDEMPLPVSAKGVPGA